MRAGGTEEGVDTKTFREKHPEPHHAPSAPKRTRNKKKGKEGLTATALQNSMHQETKVMALQRDQCGMVWCGVVWCCVVLCGVVWCCVVLCGVVWCCVVLCGVVVRWCCEVVCVQLLGGLLGGLCGVVWCCVVLCGVVWCGVVVVLCVVAVLLCVVECCGVLWWCGGVVCCGVLWCVVVRCGALWGVRCEICVVCCFVYIHNARRVYVQKRLHVCAVKTAVCHVTHRRVDGTHGGVFECTHGRVSGRLSLSAHLSLPLVGSLSVLNDDDNTVRPKINS